MLDNLTEKNFSLFAAKCYEDPNCVDVLEFQQDIDRIKYIKRLLRKHDETGILKERLILNHIIILNNLFGPDACSTLLLFKIQTNYWSTLKAFLIFLNILREDELRECPINEHVLLALRKL